MRYLLNSAVITRPGTYTYCLATPEEAAAWINSGEWVSRIGYPATADRVHTLSGIRPGLNREATAMQPGDEALVVRLKYRMQNPGQKASYLPGPEDWEYGILRLEE